MTKESIKRAYLNGELRFKTAVEILCNRCGMSYNTASNFLNSKGTNGGVPDIPIIE